ncbi:MAG TPA: glucose 1-dehydrogenase [Candidatus Limnocylindrales bacterium]|nr:glucose 1-dehydrogenase [Candidatus Limnocylindrales bacterium]
MQRLEGKVAVITGGASGIGEATARLFAREGARLVVADVNDERGQRLARDIGQAAVYVHADVSREEDVHGCIDAAVRKHGRLDVVFNNAGFGGTIGPIAEIPVEEYDVTMNVLVRGVFLGMKHAAPILAAQGSGSIISTASVAGLRAGYSPHIYSAAKAAVIALTRTVAMELGERGVRVNCICPGAIATPLLAGAFVESMGGVANPEREDEAITMVKQSIGAMQPIQRPGLPEDIANAALWLASEESSFVNGHALVVDGGLTGGTMWSMQIPFMRERREMKR